MKNILCEFPEDFPFRLRKDGKPDRRYKLTQIEEGIDKSSGVSIYVKGDMEINEIHR